MKAIITPSNLSGTIVPPPSKSQAHRLLIAAALANGEGRISNLADSQDILATKACIAALKEPCDGLPHLECGESGSTLRFFIPIALALRNGGVFTGKGRLMERPQKPYFDMFDRIGVQYSLENGVLTIAGALVSGRYELPGDVSSQFITGLLYALPLLNGDSEICLTTKLESEGYVDMTLEVLEKYGIRIECIENGWKIPGGQTYVAVDAAVEADWSQAGFWYAAAGVGNEVEIDGMNPMSTQGDMRIVPYYMKLSHPGDVELDVSQCPDLVPPLAAHAALRKGTTEIINAGRLRMKESDRLAAVTQVLTAMGAEIEEHPEGLTIVGKEKLAGGVTVDSHNDHRIAMMAAMAATRCENPVTVTGAQSVRKSYPNFWEDYVNMGGQVELVED